MNIHSIRRIVRCLPLAAAIFTLASCGGEEEAAVSDQRSLIVDATAYNSLEEQTKKGDPATAAWGDKLEPGMKAIAVSRDLIEMGLDHRTPVRIEGLPGEYMVLDKMNKRWTKKIDIYMGTDEQAAREWGKRRVRITWNEGAGAE